VKHPKSNTECCHEEERRDSGRFKAESSQLLVKPLTLRRRSEV